LDVSVYAPLATILRPVLAWAIDIPTLALIGGGLVTLSVAAWLQARQWRLRHSLLSSDFQTVAAERSQAELARVQTEVFYHSLVETIPR